MLNVVFCQRSTADDGDNIISTLRRSLSERYKQVYIYVIVFFHRDDCAPLLDV